jgi:hypothetical protein
MFAIPLLFHPRGLSVKTIEVVGGLRESQAQRLRLR